MKINEIYTPAILIDLDKMEHNLEKVQLAAAKYNKQVWPMLKTHKCSELAKLQVEKYGCTGVLCGTLDEAEAMVDAGVENVMYAYPVASKESVHRVIEMVKKCPGFIERLDSVAVARMLNDAAAEAGVKVGYSIIIDTGLHRFGIVPERAVDFANELKKFDHLVLKAISSHPGQVYGAKNDDEVKKCAQEEARKMGVAAKALRAAGYELEHVTSGSTPTFMKVLPDSTIDVYHPGCHIFNDAMQMSMEVVTEEDCALTVIATIISNPEEGHFIMDAGTKCLALDQGGHGNSNVKGFGHVIGHPELLINSLSEEVGNLRVEGGHTDLKIGDKIRIVPNHACPCANLTSYYFGVRGDEVERLIFEDLRSNSTKKNF